MAESKSPNTLINTHTELLLMQLNEFRKTEEFSDVVLKCNGVSVVAHKNILAAASPYFLAMFGGNFPESTQREIHMQDMDADSLEAAVEFIYTGFLEISTDNVQNLMTTAAFLQIQEAADICAEFMATHMDADNCVTLKRFGEKHENYSLVDAAKEFIVANFYDVMNSNEFMQMTFEELEEVLRNDDLYMQSDDALLRGLCRWGSRGPISRATNLGSLVSYLNPACVTPRVARSMSVLSMDSESQHWLHEVQRSETNLEWAVYVVDKMGRQQPDMHRYDKNFERVRHLKALPRPAFAISLAVYGNTMYVQGGSKGHSTANTFYYNMYRDIWRETNPMLLERSHHRSLAVYDNLYALGGNCSQGATATVECMSLTTSKSVFKDNMRTKRSSMGALVYDNTLYVMGGETDHRSLYTMERYDPRLGQWQEMPSMSEVNSYCSSATIDTHIYCCEGLGSSMERFDFRANKWMVIDFWEEREFYEIFNVDNKLYSVAGDNVAVFDTVASRWRNIYRFPKPREWDTAVAVPMKIY